MNVLVCLLSSQGNIIKTMNRERDRLIPKDLFKNKKGPDYPVSFKVAIFDPSTATIDFEKFLLSVAKGKDAVILLVERQYFHLIASVANAVFAATFDLQNDDVNNFKNFFGSYFSPLFRNLFAVKTLMQDANKKQAMMLPLRNFKAAELNEMARLSREESRSGRFVFNIEACVAGIIKRKVPRKDSNSKTKYFVDDNGIHFEYGHEEHAHFDTSKPHVAACEFNGSFRFGNNIETRKHYNVSFGSGDRTGISGKFTNCHDAEQQVPENPHKTHLNMFANDFF